VRRRLATELVRRGLAEARAQARQLVVEGRVLVGGVVADKATRLVAGSDPIVVQGAPRPFVSRGGEKLAAALQRFAVDVSGRRCLDAGASTGGFTDCLLHNGARAVVAVDVGHGQLHPTVRGHGDVSVLERTNIRHLGLADVGGAPFDVVVADLSFISITTVAPTLAGPLAAPGADLVVLVKPQFEAGRAEVSRGRGVIRDPAVRRQALRGAASALVGAGATIMGAMASPILGPAGNAEFLLHARAHASTPGTTPATLDATVTAMVDAAVADAPDAVAGAPASPRPE